MNWYLLFYYDGGDVVYTHTLKDIDTAYLGAIVEVCLTDSMGVEIREVDKEGGVLKSLN